MQIEPYSCLQLLALKYINVINILKIDTTEFNFKLLYNFCIIKFIKRNTEFDYTKVTVTTTFSGIFLVITWWLLLKYTGSLFKKKKKKNFEPQI